MQRFLELFVDGAMVERRQTRAEPETILFHLRRQFPKGVQFRVASTKSKDKWKRSARVPVKTRLREHVEVLRKEISTCQNVEYVDWLTEMRRMDAERWTSFVRMMIDTPSPLGLAARDISRFI